MKTKQLLLLLAALLMLSGCADSITLQEAITAEPVGFWSGWWHGCILPIAWFISLFDSDVAIYAINNNGGWYDFGFFVGVGGITSVVKVVA